MATDAAGTDGPSEVARACLAAHQAQDWDRLQTLFHPDARIGTFAGGGRPEEPAEALGRLRDAHEDLIYHADVTNLEVLDEDAVLMEGHVRYRTPQHGWGINQRSWLYVVRDGLLYRSAVYPSRHAALTEYRTLGPTLGVRS